MKEFVVGLCGSPNTGKSTIFNALTEGDQTIGNWPGVTVEKREGKFTYNDISLRIIDLPGTYSLTYFTIDEQIATEFIEKGEYDLLIGIVNAASLETSLNLIIETLELGRNLVIAINMMDILSSRGYEIDTQKLSKTLGVEIVETIAHKNIGLDKLKEAVLRNISTKKRGEFRVFYGEDFEQEIEKLEKLISGQSRMGMLSSRYIALKLLEGDKRFIAWFHEDPKFNDAFETTRKRLGKKFGDDLGMAIVERRYAYINGLVRECRRKKTGFKERVELTDKLDKVLTNKYIGVPLLLFTMFLAFQFVFATGEPLIRLTEYLFKLIGSGLNFILNSLGAPTIIFSFLNNAILEGLGTVLKFVPNIFLLFLLLTILEDSGYMARIAFVADSFMHRIGLHSKSVVPMILGFGCNVPAIMSCRTLGTTKDRIITILIIPLMSCSARLPVYTFFASVFFPENKAFVILSLYLLGIGLAIIMATIFKRIFFTKETEPLILELPAYKVPQLRFVLSYSWYRTRLFITRAGTLIFMGVVIAWALSSLPPGVEYASKESILGKIGGAIAPIFKKAGFGFWQASASLLLGFYAKELVMGVLSTVFSSSQAPIEIVLRQYFTPLSAYSFMIMTLLYIPCIATFFTIKSETNWFYAIFTVTYTLLLGWTTSVVFYQLGSLISSVF